MGIDPIHRAKLRSGNYEMPYTAYDGYPDNQWWVAATSKEVTERPIARVLLEQAVIIYRPAPREIAILEDRCSHRQIPLSLGKRVGRDIQCVYHGLRFGPDGACVFAPAFSKPLPAADVISYPTVERHGYVWVWFGSGEPRDELIPDYSWQTSSEYTGNIGYATIGCSYLLGMENVLDTTHFAWLHPNSVGSAGYEQGKQDVTAVGEEVHSIRRVVDLAPSGLFSSFTNSKVTLTDRMRWKGPSYMFLETTIEAPERIFHMRGLAPYTPEHRDSHHHWYAHFVNFEMPAGAAKKIAAVAKQAIEEDRQVLEINQRRIDNGEAREPVMLPGDKAAVLMRRLNHDLLKREGLYQPRQGNAASRATDASRRPQSTPMDDNPLSQ